MGSAVHTPTFYGDWQNFRRRWGWFLVFGIVSMILGVIALVDSILITIVSMIFFGWILLIAGIVEAVHAFGHRHGGHLLLHSLNAVLSFVVGLMLLRHPVAGALVMTLLLAVYFIVAGIFRIVAAASHRLPHRGWALANGIITLIFGILVWAQWPVSGLWIIGLFIGIDLVITGWTQVMLAITARRLLVEPA